MRLSTLLWGGFSAALLAGAHAQSVAPRVISTPVPVTGTNYVLNGNFAKTTPVDNLWDGVNSLGGLAGFVRSAYAVTENGPPGGVALPSSVNWIDMNNDGLMDIATCDPLGVMRVYYNSGTKTAPKFTVAETVPLFLSRPSKDEDWDNFWGHGSPKIALFDPSKRGTPDLYVGNYAGEILLVHNTGTPSSPLFPQPANYEKSTIPTSKKGELWGNLFAPCIFDWNRDGKPDMLIGEGSYSANAIHLLINEGAGGEPKFTPESRYYLCYGDGREHLVPTVADYNGDGLPDVLVGDRSGTVAVHLQAAGWKPGTELKMAKLISFGGAEKIGSAVAPCAADLNGDGLFDLLLGRADGRIQMAINTGTKEEPVFGKPIDVQGADLWAKNILQPTDWTTNASDARGNFYGYASVVDEKGPGGGSVLRMSYWPPPNKIIKMVPHTVKGTDTADFFRPGYTGIWYPCDANVGMEGKPTNCVSIRQIVRTLVNNANYTLKFKARGARFDNAKATMATMAVVELSPAKTIRKARGVDIQRNEKREEDLVEQTFAASGGWSSYSKNFTVTFNGKELHGLPGPTHAVLEFKTFLSPFDGVCDICDVEIVAAK